MARIRLQIALISILSRLIQEVVRANKLLELGLDVYNFLGGEVEFYDGDAGLFQI